jgi:hypothetical protein
MILPSIAFNLLPTLSERGLESCAVRLDLGIMAFDHQGMGWFKPRAEDNEQRG